MGPITPILMVSAPQTGQQRVMKAENVRMMIANNLSDLITALQIGWVK
jgi:hypothetical protein